MTIILCFKIASRTLITLVRPLSHLYCSDVGGQEGVKAGIFERTYEHKTGGFLFRTAADPGIRWGVQPGEGARLFHPDQQRYAYVRAQAG